MTPTTDKLDDSRCGKREWYIRLMHRFKIMVDNIWDGVMAVGKSGEFNYVALVHIQIAATSSVDVDAYALCGLEWGNSKHDV